MKNNLQITREEMKEYGSFFKQVRLEVGWSKTRLGNELGVNQCTIRRWEEAETIPQQDIYILKETYQYLLDKHRKRGWL